ncbi:MAG TPA: site-2 protease family protein [Candidatus Limnocylindrales bacterium]|nr:site-2 protease family protein [Candidatus Limnocylindrales bacterium]
MNGIPVARLFGIEVRVHLSWIFIIAIITVTIGGQLDRLPGGPVTPIAWLIGAAASFVFLVTVVVHELAHALVGRRFGIPADTVSVHFIGSPAVVDVRAATPRGEASVALAGPIASVAMALAAMALALLAATSGISLLEVPADILFVVGLLNLVLAGISIVPAFPLDGGRVVRAIVWATTGDERRGTRAAGRVGRWVGWVLLGSGFVVILLGRTVDGAMLGLVGWFLNLSARSVDRWLLLDGLIAGIRVGDAMEPELETISPQLTLDTFGTQVLDGTLGPALAVLRKDDVVGIIGIGQLRSVPRRDWPSTRTAEVMVDLADMPVVGPNETLADGLERLRTSHLDGLPVLDGAALRGVLTRRSIAVALRAKADLQGIAL